MFQLCTAKVQFPVESISSFISLPFHISLEIYVSHVIKENGPPKLGRLNWKNGSPSSSLVMWKKTFWII